MSKMSAGPAPMATLPQMALNEGFGFSQQSLMTQVIIILYFSMELL